MQLDITDNNSATSDSDIEDTVKESTVKKSAAKDNVINSYWQADLELRITQGNNGARLTRNRHSGPLYVQKPFYPEGKDCAHIYLLHPPGGLVSGDTLDVSIDVQEHAHALVTTPGAAKMYKARKGGQVQRQNTRLRVDSGASLEWFPMEAIVYPGADAELKTTIALSDQSHFMGWEITCFGLPASDDAFDTGSFKQQYRIEHNGYPVFIDNIYLSSVNNIANDALFSGLAGMQSQPISGFFIAGPIALSAIDKEHILEQLRHKITDSGLQNQMAVTYVNQFFIVRYLGKSAYIARQGFVELWHILRPLLIDRNACNPRIWLT